MAEVFLLELLPRSSAAPPFWEHAWNPTARRLEAP
jgi:hypothetical protein